MQCRIVKRIVNIRLTGQMSYGSYHHDMGHNSLTTVWRLLNIRCTNLERKEGKHAGQETGTGTGRLFSG